MFELLRTYTPTHLTPRTILLAFLVAFVAGVLVGKTYERTHRGLSWSPALVQAMPLGALVACMVMLAIGDNVAGAIGIIGSLAIIRFRTNLRDPRDMVFIFAALGTGVACGLLAFVPAVIGCGMFCAAALLISGTGFGTRRGHDGLLRFQAPPGANESVVQALRQGSASFSLVTLREVAQGRLVDHAYQIRLRSDGDPSALLAGLRSLEGVEGVFWQDQQATVEV